MARTIVTLEPETLYRAVMLRLFPGVHDMELHEYTDANGDTFKYHSVSVFGPYSAKGTATAQVNRMLKDHKSILNRRTNPPSPAGGYSLSYWSPNGTAPEVNAFVEEMTPSWSVVAGTEKTA